jgi:hypothetical protein
VDRVPVLELLCEPERFYWINQEKLYECSSCGSDYSKGWQTEVLWLDSRQVQEIFLFAKLPNLLWGPLSLRFNK